MRAVPSRFRASQSGFGDGMTIHNLFKSSSFGPEEIAILEAAYEAALRKLGLRQRDDPLTEFVAKKIIANAQT